MVNAPERRAAESIEIGVAGLDCPSCAVAIESGLAQLPGVETVTLDLDAGRAPAGCHPAIVSVDALPTGFAAPRIVAKTWAASPRSSPGGTVTTLRR